MSTKKPGRLRKALVGALLNNFWLKFISIAFSISVFAFISSSKTVQRTFSVPIIAEMPRSEGRQLMSEIPVEVKVIVKGPRQKLDSIGSEDIGPILLNLTAAQDVPRQPITADMIPNLPKSVKVEKIIPSSFEIRWENRIERTIDVQVGRIGEPSAGMEVKAMFVKPEVVKATGPESLVNVIQVVRAEPFDVSGLVQGRISRQLALNKPPSEEVTYDVGQVEVTVEITRKMAQRELQVPVEVIGVAHAKTAPATVFVQVTGPPEVVEAIKEEAIVARVEPPNPEAKTASEHLPVLVDVPDVSKVVVNPKKVVVKW